MDESGAVCAFVFAPHKCFTWPNIAAQAQLLPSEGFELFLPLFVPLPCAGAYTRERTWRRLRPRPVPPYLHKLVTREEEGWACWLRMWSQHLSPPASYPLHVQRREAEQAPLTPAKRKSEDESAAKPSSRRVSVQKNAPQSKEGDRPKWAAAPSSEQAVCRT